MEIAIKTSDLISIWYVYVNSRNSKHKYELHLDLSGGQTQIFEIYFHYKSGMKDEVLLESEDKMKQLFKEVVSFWSKNPSTPLQFNLNFKNDDTVEITTRGSYEES